MQARPSLLKPGASEEAESQAPQIKQSPSDGAEPSSSNPIPPVSSSRPEPTGEELIARILADGINIPDAQAQLEGAHHSQPEMNYIPLTMDGQPGHPMVSMPFQALLQSAQLPSEALQMLDPAAAAQLDAAARKIAWAAINPHAMGMVPHPIPINLPQQLALVPTLGLTDRADPAWSIWEERFQFLKAHGLGGGQKQERLVYKRAMPHARRSLSAISPEDEAADRESCARLNEYLVQKLQRLKEYNLLPPAQ